MSGCLIPEPKPAGKRVFLKYTRVTRIAGGEGTLTPVVLSTSRGMGKEAERLIRQMAERMCIKKRGNYSSVVSFLSRRSNFYLLKTCVIAMRGFV